MLSSTIVQMFTGMSDPVGVVSVVVVFVVIVVVFIVQPGWVKLERFLLTAGIGVGEVVNDHCAVDASEADALREVSNRSLIAREETVGQLTSLPT